MFQTFTKQPHTFSKCRYLMTITTIFRKRNEQMTRTATKEKIPGKQKSKILTSSKWMALYKEMLSLSATSISNRSTPTNNSQFFLIVYSFFVFRLNCMRFCIESNYSGTGDRERYFHLKLCRTPRQYNSIEMLFLPLSQLDFVIMCEQHICTVS